MHRSADVDGDDQQGVALSLSESRPQSTTTMARSPINMWVRVSRGVILHRSLARVHFPLDVIVRQPPTIYRSRGAVVSFLFFFRGREEWWWCFIAAGREGGGRRGFCFVEVLRLSLWRNLDGWVVAGLSMPGGNPPRHQLPTYGGSLVGRRRRGGGGRHEVVVGRRSRRGIGVDVTLPRAPHTTQKKTIGSL
jgi:hypothetical protein